MASRLNFRAGAWFIISRKGRNHPIAIIWDRGIVPCPGDGRRKPLTKEAEKGTQKKRRCGAPRPHVQVWIRHSRGRPSPDTRDSVRARDRPLLATGWHQLPQHQARERREGPFRAKHGQSTPCPQKALRSATQWCRHRRQGRPGPCRSCSFCVRALVAQWHFNG